MRTNIDKTKKIVKVPAGPELTQLSSNQKIAQKLQGGNAIPEASTGSRPVDISAIDKYLEAEISRLKGGSGRKPVENVSPMIFTTEMSSSAFNTENSVVVLKVRNSREKRLDFEASGVLSPPSSPKLVQLKLKSKKNTMDQVQNNQYEDDSNSSVEDLQPKYRPKVTTVVPNATQGIDKLFVNQFSNNYSTKLRPDQIQQTTASLNVTTTPSHSRNNSDSVQKQNNPLSASVHVNSSVNEYYANSRNTCNKRVTSANSSRHSRASTPASRNSNTSSYQNTRRSFNRSNSGARTPTPQTNTTRPAPLSSSQSQCYNLSSQIDREYTKQQAYAEQIQTLRTVSEELMRSYKEMKEKSRVLGVLKAQYDQLLALFDKSVAERQQQQCTIQDIHKRLNLLAKSTRDKLEAS